MAELKALKTVLKCGVSAMEIRINLFKQADPGGKFLEAAYRAALVRKALILPLFPPLSR